MTQLDLFASDPTEGLKASHGLAWHALVGLEHFRAVVTTRPTWSSRGHESTVLCGEIHRRVRVGGGWLRWVPVLWFNSVDRMHEVIRLGGLDSNRWPCAEPR